MILYVVRFSDGSFYSSYGPVSIRECAAVSSRDVADLWAKKFGGEVFGYLDGALIRL